ncbi:MAG TPA: protein translocase subunit SecF [Nevskiaceae bacterium]|nr:protein translocase subunit SecF [Nevskiaceae bacterium]
MRFLSRPPSIDWESHRKQALVVSIILSVIALGLLFTRGLNLGIDFTGGVLVEVVYPQSVDLNKVRTDLRDGGFHEAVVQYFGNTEDILIRLRPPKSEAVGAAAKKQSSEISSRVLLALHANTDKITLKRVDFVGPSVGGELRSKGALALLAAFGGIFLYIMFRFEWKFSCGSIAALLHDLIMTMGFLSLVREQFDMTTLAGVLAMLGYSNNETIVLFDRVRENLREMRKQPPIEKLVNLSINQTLMRSVVTHFTVLLVLIALHTLGGPSVHGFATAMIVGVCVATYSSIYISSGVAIMLKVKREDVLPPKDSVSGSRDSGGAVV